MKYQYKIINQILMANMNINMVQKILSKLRLMENGLFLEKFIKQNFGTTNGGKLYGK